MRVVMLGTRWDTMGGISAVVNVYRAVQMFDRLGITYLATHRDGSVLQKLGIFGVALLRLGALLVTKRVDLLHVHMSSGSSFLRKSIFLHIAFVFDIPAVVHLHSGRFDRYFETSPWVLRSFIRFTLRRARKLIVLSRSWKGWAETVLEHKAVEVLCNPVIIPKRTTRDFAQNWTVLTLGRLGKNKGTYDLVYAFSTVVGKYPKARLMLGGDGDLEQIADLAKSLGLSGNVFVLGWVDQEKKSSLLGDARMYVLPSYSEGLPMSVLEAMAAGLPLIVTPVGGIPEVVDDGVEGFLVPPGNPAILADRIMVLFGRDDLCQRMGESGKRRLEGRAEAGYVVGRLEALYAEVLQARVRE